MADKKITKTFKFKELEKLNQFVEHYAIYSGEAKWFSCKQNNKLLTLTITANYFHPDTLRKIIVHGGTDIRFL